MLATLFFHCTCGKCQNRFETCSLNKQAQFQNSVKHFPFKDCPHCRVFQNKCYSSVSWNTLKNIFDILNNKKMEALHTKLSMNRNLTKTGSRNFLLPYNPIKLTLWAPMVFLSKKHFLIKKVKVWLRTFNVKRLFSILDLGTLEVR